jgi:hypothetical protein
MEKEIANTAVTHICKPLQANAQSKACKRVCLPQPVKNFKIFLPSLKKKLKHANTRAIQTEKENVVIN